MSLLICIIYYYGYISLLYIYDDIEDDMAEYIASDEDDLFSDEYMNHMEGGHVNNVNNNNISHMQDPGDLILLSNRSSTMAPSRVDLNDPREYGLVVDETHYPVKRYKITNSNWMYLKGSQIWTI